jgi:hypothetical protein
MTTHFCRARRAVFLTAIGWSWAVEGTRDARRQRGVVTDTTGATMKGTLAEVTDGTVRLYVDGRIRVKRSLPYNAACRSDILASGFCLPRLGSTRRS